MNDSSWRTGLHLILTLLLFNAVAISSQAGPPLLMTIFLIVLVIAYIVINLMPVSKASGSLRLRSLAYGCRLIALAATAMTLQFILTTILLIMLPGLTRPILIDLALAAGLGAILLANGMIRVAVSARQVKLHWYVLLLLAWWVPLLNLVIIAKFYRTAQFEYRFELARQEVDSARQESSICQTRYPLLMVHGVFFRDWMVASYWGRIPGALIRNGATVHYGKQQSSSGVIASAAELRDRIEEIVRQTGCGKVNIIAHSKGGLDSRYAISVLGAGKHVASLTTINTPHHGCRFVDRLLVRMKPVTIQKLAARYNKIYLKLGDHEPDFVSGVQDLTTAACTARNQAAPDDPDVYYQSVMSRMRGLFSAGFPLNLGFWLANRASGPNDGLVDVKSAAWGQSFRLVEPTTRRGISHGDMIDLMRENIKGFDVREFYVDLVRDLKTRGY